MNPTGLFFGSARSKDREDYDLTLAELTEELAAVKSPEEAVVRCIRLLMLASLHWTAQAIETKLERLRATEWMCEYYEKVHQVFVISLIH